MYETNACDLKWRMVYTNAGLEYQQIANLYMYRHDCTLKKSQAEGTSTAKDPKHCLNTDR